MVPQISTCTTCFIGKRYMSPLSVCPVAVLACKFQPSLPMNSFQHRSMNKTSGSEAQTQQRLLNRCLGDTVGSPWFILAVSCSMVERLFARTPLRIRHSPLSSMARGAPYLPGH
ncbi:hypothetical protein TNCV_2945891 [Trichonephila clavipes]|nr:hypothetical protein TNCV_2945891 [Trichonephila clavipes]